MVADGTVFVATFLLFLGVTSIILGTLTAGYTTRRSPTRGLALVVVGTGAIIGMVYVLWEASWGAVWDDVLWPVLVMGAAFVGGASACLGLVYIIVGSR
jgi:hypothetical protein